MIEIGLNNVCKSFGDKSVLKNISFEVKTGDNIALMFDEIEAIYRKVIYNE